MDVDQLPDKRSSLPRPSHVRAVSHDMCVPMPLRLFALAGLFALTANVDLLVRVIIIVMLLLVVIIVIVLIFEVSLFAILLEIFVGQCLPSEPVDGSWNELLLDVLAELVVELKTLFNI